MMTPKRRLNLRLIWASHPQAAVALLQKKPPTLSPTNLNKHMAAPALPIGIRPTIMLRHTPIRSIQMDSSIRYCDSFATSEFSMQDCRLHHRLIWPKLQIQQIGSLLMLSRFYLNPKRRIYHIRPVQVIIYH